MKRLTLGKKIVAIMVAWVSYGSAYAQSDKLSLVPALSNQKSGSQVEQSSGKEVVSEPLEIQQVGFLDAESCDDTAPCGDACDEGMLPGLFKRPFQKTTCPPPWWAHRTGAFGEFLYLRPGSSDLIFATEQTDPDPTVASPTGPVGFTSIDAEAGFRVGFSLAASQCTSLSLSYARWEGDDQSRIAATGLNVLGSNVIHPSTLTSGAASLEATAAHDQMFQVLDLKYRHLWRHTETTALNWFAGVRYGNLEQNFSADQTIAVATGLTNVTTAIDFHGFGLSSGLDFETYSCTTGLGLYGSAAASLLAGEWKASYAQRNQFGGGVVANRYEDFHATPILDAELGIRWTGCNQHLRLSCGFLMSGWYETVTTRSYIDAVRAGLLTDAGETQTFSGLTSRVEYRF